MSDNLVIAHRVDCIIFLPCRTSGHTFTLQSDIKMWTLGGGPVYEISLCPMELHSSQFCIPCGQGYVSDFLKNDQRKQRENRLWDFCCTLSMAKVSTVILVLTFHSSHFRDGFSHT